MTENNQQLTTQPARELEPAPAYFKEGDRRGLENITKRDMLIPRLALAQALSPQVTDGDPNRIEGLKVGDLFNSVTGQNYGREVIVQIVRKDQPRAMEFYSIEDGGGVKDPDVPLNDDRLKWGEDGEKPQAMLFLDYIAFILPTREMISLSFKGSGISVARRLAGLIVMRNRPIYSGKYRITTGVELKPKPHQIYKVENAGWVSEPDAIEGEQVYEAIRHMDVTIDRSTQVEETDNPNASAATAGAAAPPSGVSEM